MREESDKDKKYDLEEHYDWFYAMSQTNRFALSSLRKQGSRNSWASVDSRFCGNDR